MENSEYFTKLKSDREYQEATAELEYQFRFGNVVLRARLDKGLTQKELAKRAGTKQANISRIEGGLANPTMELIQKLCKVLDLELAFQSEIHKPETESTVVTNSFTSVEPENQSILVENWPGVRSINDKNTSTNTYSINQGE